MKNSDILTKIVVPILAACLSAILVFYATPDWEKSAIDHNWIPKTEWQQVALKNGWILKEDCPANPVTLKIIGPGDKSVIYVDYNILSGYCTIEENLIVETSKSVEIKNLGFLVESSSSQGYRMIFPTFIRKNSPKIIQPQYFRIPYKPELNEKLTIWAIYFENTSSISSTYSDFQQVSELPNTLAISSPVEWFVSFK